MDRMGCRLIADGGSSKVHWAVVDGDGRVKKTFFSKGVNPFVTGEDVIREVFEREVKAELEGMAVERVEFYGAGCRDHGIDVMRSAIRWLVGDGADVVVAWRCWVKMPGWPVFSARVSTAVIMRGGRLWKRCRRWVMFLATKGRAHGLGNG